MVHSFSKRNLKLQNTYKKKVKLCTSFDGRRALQEVETSISFKQLRYKGGKVVSPTPRLPLAPRADFWYSFLIEAESIKAYSAAGRIKSMKNSSDSIGNRIRDLPASSAEPEQAALRRTLATLILAKRNAWNQIAVDHCWWPLAVIFGLLLSVGTVTFNSCSAKVFFSVSAPMSTMAITFKARCDHKQLRLHRGKNTLLTVSGLYWNPYGRMEYHYG